MPNLYSMLLPEEVEKLKASKSDIRNCKLNDLTIEELNDLHTFVFKGSALEVPNVYPETYVLAILLTRNMVAKIKSNGKVL